MVSVKELHEREAVPRLVGWVYVASLFNATDSPED
jgi:hypothetical protein